MSAPTTTGFSLSTAIPWSAGSAPRRARRSPPSPIWALAFAEAGRVLLVQERLGDGVYRYLAVIASQRKQAARPMSRPVVLIPQARSGAMPIAAEELA
jgi:hypothetical protein